MSEWRYMTLKEARALECNRCGDCCSSKAAAGNLRWGRLPMGQYQELNYGRPLIIPVNPITFQDIPWSPEMDVEAKDARDAPCYRCEAYVGEQEGGCLLHGRRRPEPCEGFPVDYADLDLETEPFIVKATNLFRCTWWAVVIVPESHEILGWRNWKAELEWDRLSIEQKDRVIELHSKAQPAPSPEPLTPELNT